MIHRSYVTFSLKVLWCNGRHFGLHVHQPDFKSRSSTKIPLYSAFLNSIRIFSSFESPAAWKSNFFFLFSSNVSFFRTKSLGTLKRHSDQDGGENEINFSLFLHSHVFVCSLCRGHFYLSFFFYFMLSPDMGNPVFNYKSQEQRWRDVCDVLIWAFKLLLHLER